MGLKKSIINGERREEVKKRWQRCGEKEQRCDSPRWTLNLGSCRKNNCFDL